VKTPWGSSMSRDEYDFWDDFAKSIMVACEAQNVTASQMVRDTHIHRASQVLSDTQGTLAKSHFTKVGDRDDRKIRSR
jgi:hypothetical protein